MYESTLIPMCLDHRHTIWSFQVTRPTKNISNLKDTFKNSLYSAMITLNIKQPPETYTATTF